MAKSEKILLIQDLEEDHSFLDLTLVSYTLTRASAPELFSEKMLSQKFSLLFYQLRCPLFSEYEVVEILRKNSNVTKIPIIFLSDSTEVKAIHQKAYKLPLIDFLYAPYNEDELSPLALP
jgi:CheY-like chemotaxis protein